MEPAIQPALPTVNKISLPVIIAGLVTTALTLTGVWVTNQVTDDFNIMGWYAYYVIPVGALLVGILSGSGYGLVSWKTGVRISRNLLWMVAILQVMAYLMAQYIEFRHLLVSDNVSKDIGFLDYFDYATRSYSFKERQGSGGSPLGAWGYVFRFLEIGGFTLGGLIAPIALRSKPYCESCQMYMRNKSLGLLPSGVAPKKIKRKDLKDQAEFQQEREAAWNQGMEILQTLQHLASEGKTTEFKNLLAAHQPLQKEYHKLSKRIALSLSKCPSCNSGLLSAISLSGQGDKVVRENLGSSPTEPGLGREVF